MATKVTEVKPPLVTNSGLVVTHDDKSVSVTTSDGSVRTVESEYDPETLAVYVHSVANLLNI